MAKITRPQSMPEDSRLIPEDLLSGSHEGEWVRLPLYQKGHRVSRVGHSSACGLQLVIDEQWYEEFRAYLKLLGGPGADPGEWYTIIDNRNAKTRCSPCKNDIMFDEEQPEPEPIMVGDHSPFVDPTPADRLETQRFLTKVMWAARELGATIEEAA